MDGREAARAAKRIVVKVGSSSLTHENGRLDIGRIELLARELSDLASGGRQLILVSSGAVAAGMGRLGLAERPASIPGKQALAAVGQVALMHLYDKLFAEYGQTVAQVLLSRADTMDRPRLLNARNAFLALLERGVLPIVNENDVVAVDELKIGDNDTLSAMVASLVDADLLIILSDIAGLYSANPRTHPEAVLLDRVGEITEAIEAASGGSGSARGTGGMATKVQAAKISGAAGIPLIVASSAEASVLRRLLSGEALGTFFEARGNALGFRKRWLSFGALVKGAIRVDSGCEASLSGGSSLLPAGIVAVEGEFAEGDAVRILSQAGREIGRGLSNYASADLGRIKGLRSAEIAAVLGDEPYDEAIHRDHLAMLV